MSNRFLVLKSYAFVAAVVWSACQCHAAQVLVSNTTAVSPSLGSYSEVEVELTYSVATTQVTGARFWFPFGLSGTTTATLRDGDGGNSGALVGVPVRNDGAFTVYEFRFGGSLAPRSQYYAGYAFTNSGTAINIGTTSLSAITYDASMLGGAAYAYLVPDPADPQSSTFGQYPRIEIIGVPEPGVPSTAIAGLACGGFAMWRRKRV